VTIPQGQLKNAPLLLTLAMVRLAPLAPEVAIAAGQQLVQALSGSFPVELPTLPQLAGAMPGQMLGQPFGLQPRNLMNATKDTVVSFRPDYLIVHTIAYTTFTPFLEVIRTVTQALIDIRGGIDVSALGLRYIDVINPTSGTSLADLLPSDMLPKEFDHPGATARQITGISTSQSVAHTEHGVEAVSVRCIVEPNQAVPPDLSELFSTYGLPNVLSVMNAGAQPGQVLWQSPKITADNGALLDFDAVYSFLSPLNARDTKAVTERLQHLHGLTDHAFGAVPLPAAWEQWK